MSWLDEPFFDLLSQINSLFAYFMKIAWAIAGVLLTINLGIFWIKYALTATGLKEELIRTTSACILFFIIMSSYPAIITGLNSLVYKMAMASTYTPHVGAMVDKTQDDSGFWDKKGDDADASYSDIIAQLETVGTGGEVSKQYVLDLSLGDTGYFSPNAIMRIITLIVENIWHRINLLDKNALGVPKDIFGAVMMTLCCVAVLLCGIFGAAQYFIAALEFSFISAVGVIVLPGMMWNGTKFMSEKLFGAIFGFFLKMLFVSISLMLMFSGFLATATRDFDGSIDQVIYIIFTSIIYMMICQSGPQLALSMLSGTPQMSLMEAVKAGGAFAAAGVLAGKAAQKGAQGAVIHGGGFIAQTRGSMNTGGVVVGGLKSAGESIKNTAKNAEHTFFHGKSGNNKGSTFSGSSGGKNPYSQTEKFNTPKDDENAKSVKDYMKQRYAEGQGLNKKPESPPTQNPSTPKAPSNGQQGLPQGNTPQSLPSPSAQQRLPTGNTPLGLPAPPLALPPPETSTPSKFTPPKK